MRSLANQLVQKGLAAEPISLAQEKKLTITRSVSSIENLYNLADCNSIREFREMARDILLSDLTNAKVIMKNEIIQAAHEFIQARPWLFPERENEKKQPFLWHLYSVSDLLDESPKANWPDIIQQFFSKSGVKNMRLLVKRNFKRH